MTERVTRFSVSIDRSLVEAFDRLSQRRGYANRSEAVRDAMRARLVEGEWQEGEEVAGVITLLYDHHRSGVSEALTELQHHALGCEISTTHVHPAH